MFIPRSVARVRLARLLFLGLVLGPSAFVAGWAAHLRSDGHRDHLRRSWERAIGLPVSVGRVDHPRPGVVRVDELVIGETDGRVRLTLPEAEVETSASEVRLRVARMRGDAAAARLLATMANDWLARGRRFDRNCVIEVDDFAWAAAVDPAEASSESEDGSGGLLVECVATAEARAVRVVRRVAAEQPESEVRVVRTLAQAATARTSEAISGARIDVVGTCPEPIPFSVVAALASATSLRDWSIGQAAAVSGRVEMSCDDHGWHGSMTGRVEHVDLAALGAALLVPAAGMGVVDVRSLSWSDGRLAECELECRVGRGHVAASFLGALVTMLGCRPGVAFGAAAGDAVTSFDTAGALVRINGGGFDGGGFELLAAPRLGGALAWSGNQPLVWPPEAPVAVERLAWLLVPPRTPHGPASGPGAWLLSIMPRAVDADARAAGQPTRGVSRDF